MPALDERLQRRLKSEHWLFPFTVTGGAGLYLLLALTLAASARVPLLDLFGDVYILATGTLAYAAFWGGAGILATMGYPRVLLATLPAHGLAHAGLLARALRDPPLTGTETMLTVVNVFAFLALGVLVGLVLEGAVHAARYHENRAPNAKDAGSG